MSWLDILDRLFPRPNSDLDKLLKDLNPVTSNSIYRQPWNTRLKFVGQSIYSGILLDKNLHLTCAHCRRHPGDTVAFNGTTYLVNSSVVHPKYDSYWLSYDFCMYRTLNLCTTVTFPRIGSVKVSEPVIIVRNNGTVVIGETFAVPNYPNTLITWRKNRKYPQWWNGPASPGDSGCPVFNQRLELVSLTAGGNENFECGPVITSQVISDLKKYLA